jgi:hypothetical protein
MPINSYRAALTPLVEQFHSGAISEGEISRLVADYANQENLGSAELSEYLNTTPEYVRRTLNKHNLSLNGGTGGDQYGLRGAESALTDGLGQANTTFNQGVAGLQPFVGPGQQANDMQAALSGALGAEAQAQAFEDFQASPGQQFLQEQGERALTRNAAALGGLGGDNVRQELIKYGQGLASQALQNQFGWLGDVATRGLSAGTSVGGLRGHQAQTQMTAGAQRAGFRSGAGNALSSNISNTTSNLANLLNQQGAGTADILGAGTQNINQLIQMAQQGDAQAMEQLGITLANLGIQGSSQYAGQPIIPGAQTNLLGQVGQVASGVSGIMQNFPQSNTPPHAGSYTPVYNQTSGFWQAPSMMP